MASDHHQPLSALFERARAASGAALDAEAASSNSIDALERAIAACAAAASAANAAGASPSASNGGETADDLSARDLRWALVPGWEGLARAKRASAASSSSPVASKRAALLEASERLRGFLTACRELGVAPKEALATLEEADGGRGEEEEEDEEGKEGKGRPRALSISASNPEARRAAKIAAFRAKRELQSKLFKLREKEERRRKRASSSSSSAARKEGEIGGKNNAAADDDEDDEDELREAVLAEIALTCLSAADEVLAIKEEATMLRHALRREKEAEATGSGRGGRGGIGGGAKEDEDERKRREEAAAVATALRGAFSALSCDPSGGVGAARRPTFAPASVGAVSASALGGLGGGSSSAFDRGTAAASVFRPSHLLPTLSLEEFAGREVAEARGRSEADRARRAAAAAAARDRASSADDGGDDGKTEADGGVNLDRLRALDDWKDDHPYGYGNSKRRPAATGSK